MSLPNPAHAAEIPEHISFQNIIENKDFIMGEGTAILQDSQGFMWLGGGTALIRYDGYEFRHITLAVNDNKPKEISRSFYVNTLFEDSHHTLWVGAREGLFRYDPRKETLVGVRDKNNQKTELSTTSIIHFEELPSGEILAVSRSILFIIDASTNDYTTLIPLPATRKKPIETITAYLDPAGTLWLGKAHGLESIDWKTKRVTTYKVNPGASDPSRDDAVRDIVSDGAGKLWLATYYGVVHYDPKTQESKRYINNPGDPYSLGGNDVWKFVSDFQGLLWVASDGGGLSVYDKAKDRFVNYQADPGRPGALNTNKVRTVYEDRNGDIWVGNYPVGIHFFDRSTAPIASYTANTLNPNSLSNNSVRSISEDKDGNLWVGTDGGGLNFFDRKKNTFTHFKNNPKDPTTLNGDSVLTTYIDAKGVVWVGTWQNGLASYNPADKKFTRYPFSTNQHITKNGGTSAELNNPILWSIKEDKAHNLWITTHYGGISKFNPKTSLFTHYLPVEGDPTSLMGTMVWTTLEDSSGNLWVGSTNGLSLMHPETESFSHFVSDPNDPNTLGSSNVLALFEDSKKQLWVGTESGLSVLNKNTNTFTTYNKSNGFLGDTIQQILEDADGILWVSTNNGFSSFNPETKKIKNYNRIGGRLIGAFAMHAGALSSRGEIIFGGVEGLRIFNPKELNENKKIPPIALTNFSIFSDNIAVGAADGILKTAINFTDSITLDHTKSMFTFSFSALNFRDPERNQYTYKLEGFDKNWISAGNQRTAKYTNLDAGNYVFTVKGSNNDGVWNETGKSIDITILPPIWRTWTAYLLYTLIILMLIANVVISQRQKLKDARKKIALERALNVKMKNLDSLKQNFLANTSHELRTPLNGILGLAESISASPVELPADIKQKAKMILQSGKRLDSIVNDILEFSQLANNELTLTLSDISLSPLVARVLIELEDRLTEKNLVVFSNIVDDAVVFSNDQRLSQIIHHIIDNAIKFTHQGSITIAHHQDSQFDCISITDTGIGIAPENIAPIFSAFNQVDGSAKRAVEGAGLGLSVIQKLVELHGGDVSVESVVGTGTTFHIRLPRSITAAKCEGSDIAPKEETIKKNQNTYSTQSQGSTNDRHLLQDNSTVHIQKLTALNEKIHKVHTVYFNSHLYANEASVPVLANTDKSYKILVVDDDSINRMVVKAHLRKHQFNTVEAIDGDMALKVLSEQGDIDLIILDVMMPKMTGYEACELLRKEYDLHQLPIIFLTANHQPSEILKAFAVGGNDFITKPITATSLVEKIKIHLSLLEEFRHINAQFNSKNPENTTHNPIKNDADVFAHHYLDLQIAIANIVEQIYCLIPPVDMIGCWMRNDGGNFVFINNASTLPLIAASAPLSWQEFEKITGITNNDENNISLAKNIADAAKTGRLAEGFLNAESLHCELLFCDKTIIGFILLRANTKNFMSQEYQLILTQCVIHIMAAAIKIKKLPTLPSQ